MSSSPLSGGGGMSFDYDKGRISLASHPDGGRNGGSRSRYDNIGRPIRLTGGDGQSVTMRSNARSQVIEKTDQLGKVERREYGRRGRRVGVIGPRGGETRYAYDGNGNVASLSDPLGRETRFGYDALDRVTSVTDALGRTATRTYQQDDVVDRFEDARGAPVIFSYDNTNRVRKVSFPWGGSVNIKHNNRDLETLVTYPSGRKLEFGYNNSGLLSALFRSATGGMREPNTFFSYGDNNNLAEVRTRRRRKSGFVRIPRPRSTN